jgi:hypothetical protein
MLDSLTEIRPDFMAEIVDPQAEIVGCVLEYTPVAINRVQKGYSHYRFPSLDC